MDEEDPGPAQQWLALKHTGWFGIHCSCGAGGGRGPEGGNSLQNFCDVLCIFRLPLASSVHRSQGKYNEKADEGL